jgi:hypothetical protein
VVVIDATEQPIERPIEKQRIHYSGKKKRHTQKTIVDQKTQMILATAFANGCQHDFELFKKSRCFLSQYIRSLEDTGNLGLGNLRSKKSKLHPLPKEQQASNHKLSHKRILVENVIRRLKIFRILSERYRNRRKRFSLRFNLIAAIYNLERECSV